MAQQDDDIIAVSEQRLVIGSLVFLQRHRPNRTHKWIQAMQVRCTGFFQRWGLSPDGEPRGLIEGVHPSNFKCQKWMKGLNSKMKSDIRRRGPGSLICSTIHFFFFWGRPSLPQYHTAEAFSCGGSTRANFSELLGPHNVPLLGNEWLHLWAAAEPQPATVCRTGINEDFFSALRTFTCNADAVRMVEDVKPLKALSWKF